MSKLKLENTINRCTNTKEVPQMRNETFFNLKTRFRRFTALRVGAFIVLLVSICLVNGESFAATITATAVGNLTPPTATYPATVTNGDFIISGSSKHPFIGDGS